MCGTKRFSHFLASIGIERGLTEARLQIKLSILLKGIIRGKNFLSIPIAASWSTQLNIKVLLGVIN